MAKFADIIAYDDDDNANDDDDFHDNDAQHADDNNNYMSPMKISSATAHVYESWRRPAGVPFALENMKQGFNFMVMSRLRVRV